MGSVRSATIDQDKSYNRREEDARLALLWYLWSQTLHRSCATPSFLLIRTETDLSWWQNKHVKLVSTHVVSITVLGYQAMTRT